MTDDEARKMATRIIDTWPSGPKGYIWQNELVSLDHDIASETFTALRRDNDRPSLAQFHAVYRSIRQRTTLATVPVNCELCDGTGWAEVTDDRRHSHLCNNRGTCYCHAVEPCRCTAGQQAQPVHATILEHNGRRA